MPITPRPGASVTIARTVEAGSMMRFHAIVPARCPLPAPTLPDPLESGIGYRESSR